MKKISYRQSLSFLFAAVFVSILPFLWLFTKSSYPGGLIATTANIIGLVGGTLLLWQFILGNRFISVRISKDYVRNTKLHIFLGTYGTVMVLLHPILETIVYWPVNLLVSNASLGKNFNFFLLLGKISLILFLFIWITSALLRSKIKYRPWQYIHYLAYPTIVLMFLHSRQIGTFLNTISWLRGYWNLLTLIFVVGVVIRLLAYFNLFKRQYKLINKKHLDGDIVKYVFQAKGQGIKPKAGQFAYLRPFFFAEAHPYTIANFKGDKLTFCIKKVGRHSKNMDKFNVGDTVYLDGPYGVFTREGHNNKPKILIAGGIGITPFISLVRNYGDRNTYMFYSNKFLNFAVMRDLFKKKLGNNYVDVVTEEKIKSKNIENKRIDTHMIKKYIDKKVLQNANVFLCGSVSFMDGVSKSLDELGIPKEKIYKEEFSL